MKSLTNEKGYLMNFNIDIPNSKGLRLGASCTGLGRPWSRLGKGARAFGRSAWLRHSRAAGGSVRAFYPGRPMRAGAAWGGWAGRGAGHFFQTMKHQLYFPPRLAEQLQWLRRFQSELPGCLAELEAVQPLSSFHGLVEEVLRDLDWLIYVMGPAMTALRAQSKAMTAVQRGLLVGDAWAGKLMTLPAMTLPQPPAGPRPRAGALRRVFLLVQVMKRQPAFNEVMGTRLGVLGNHYKNEALVPECQLRVERGPLFEVVRGRMKGTAGRVVQVMSRRGGGDWEKLDVFTRARFVDKRPLLAPGTPEVREYQLCFFEDDKPSGQWSPVYSATVSP